MQSISSTTTSTNGGQGLITALGTGSGLDLEGLVTKIIGAQRAPVQARLDFEKTQAEANISAFGSLKSTLASLQSALGNLKNASFFSTQSATSGNTSLYTATSDGTATPGNYRVEVFDMAQSSKVVSKTGFTNPDSTLGSGTLNIGLVGGNSFAISVANSDSLATIRDNINQATDNVGVTASLITVDAGVGDGSTVTKLMLVSNQSGNSNQMTLSTIDNDGNNTDNNGLSRLYFDGSNPSAAGNQMQSIDEAQDARIAVDGFTAYSSTNAFKNVVAGVTINILKGDEGAATPPSANLLISTDKTAVKGEVKGFVAIFNAAITVLNKLTSYDPSTKAAGLLNGDSSINNIRQKIRQNLFGSVSSATSAFNTLANAGITTNADGTLTINDKTLDSAIANNFTDLKKIFSNSDGLATKLDAELKNILGSNGSIKTREDGFLNQLKDIDSRNEKLNKSLSVQEATLRNQFAALDTLIFQLKKTGSFLDQQFSSLNSDK